MQSKLNPYLIFKNSAREAMEFYKSVFGGTLTISTFKDYHASNDPNDDNLIMHAMLIADNGITLMGADALTSMGEPGGNGSISLSGDNEAELRGYWNALAAGSTITTPIETAPWGDTFGMLTDKFGVDWMVNIAGKQA